MTTATAPLTVPTTCACGASFAREVRRGRPQVWCPACIEIPFEKRLRSPQTVAEFLVEGAVPTERVKNQWDENDNVRTLIEAGVAQVYADWTANGTAATLRAEGKSPFDIADAQRVALTEAYKTARTTR